MIELEVTGGVAQGQTIKTKAPFVSIGRSPEHTIVVTDGYVSRHHGEILLLESGYQYRDLNSTHGTVLRRKGQQNFIKQVVLQENDELSLGGTENVVLVVKIAEDKLERREHNITMLHAPEDRFAAPEEMFANDSKALRAIVEFDSLLMDSKLASEQQFLRILLEHLPHLFSNLAYVSIMNFADDKLSIYDSLQVIPDARVRISSKVIGLATERKKQGFVFQISGKDAILDGGPEVTLSEKSQIQRIDVENGFSGICIPIATETAPTKFLQFERSERYGHFLKEDVGLVACMVSRVADRILHLDLIQTNQQLNLSATLGVFAGMIGHDIKNYLFYSKNLSEIQDDTLSMHPGIMKGIERGRKLAQSMKDLAAPGKAPIETFSLGDVVKSTAQEFNSLFGTQCRFEAEVSPKVEDISTCKDLISRVIWNLVMNAYHSSENRPRHLTEAPYVRICITPSDPYNVVIEIMDNAGGIGPRTLKYIQESFELIHQAYQNKEQLMAVVQKIRSMSGFTNSIGLFFTGVAINDMSGDVSVEVREGLGSIFTLQIPTQITTLKNLLHF
jgi:pSer/pThr/pTyr-binding forkhead associated (FHA) protein